MPPMTEPHLRLFRVDAGPFYYVAARDVAEALSLVRDIEKQLGAYEEFCDLDGARVDELSETKARALRHNPGDGEPGEVTDVWTAFQRMTEPSCFACSEWA